MSFCVLRKRSLHNLSDVVTLAAFGCAQWFFWTGTLPQRCNHPPPYQPSATDSYLCFDIQQVKKADLGLYFDTPHGGRIGVVSECGKPNYRAWGLWKKKVNDMTREWFTRLGYFLLISAGVWARIRRKFPGYSYIYCHTGGFISTTPTQLWADLAVSRDRLASSVHQSKQKRLYLHM